MTDLYQSYTAKITKKFSLNRRLILDVWEGGFPPQPMR